MATAGVLGAMAGAHALRQLGERVRGARHQDDLLGEDFTALYGDRARIVFTDDGVPLCTRTCGDENAALSVIFVHGFCNTMQSFHFQRQGLEDLWPHGERMVFYDQRGHGRSGTPGPAGCTARQLGRDLVTVIRACAPTGPLMLVGHSMGGMAILAAVAQYPQLMSRRVRAVALVATAAAGITSGGVGQLLRHPAVGGFRLLAHSAPALVQVGRATGRHVISPVLHAGSFSGDVSPTLSRFNSDMISRTPVRTITTFLGALETHDEVAALPQLVRMPGLVLAGTRDVVIPFDNARVLAQALPRAELVAVPDAAHMVHLQYPAVVNTALNRLLNRCGGVDSGRRAAHG